MNTLKKILTEQYAYHISNGYEIFLVCKKLLNCSNEQNVVVSKYDYDEYGKIFLDIVDILSKKYNIKVKSSCDVLKSLIKIISKPCYDDTEFNNLKKDFKDVYKSFFSEVQISF